MTCSGNSLQSSAAGEAVSGPVRVQSHRQSGKAWCAAALVPAPAAPAAPTAPTAPAAARGASRQVERSTCRGAHAHAPLTLEVGVQVDLPIVSAHGDEKGTKVRTTLACSALLGCL